MFGRKSKIKETSQKELSHEERSSLMAEHDNLMAEMVSNFQKCPSCDAKVDFTGNKKRILQIRSSLKMEPLNTDIYQMSGYNVLANKTTKIRVGRCTACGAYLAKIGNKNQCHVLNGPEKAAYYYAQGEGVDMDFSTPSGPRRAIDEFLWEEAKDLRKRFEMECKELKARGFKVVKEDKTKAREEDEKV